MQDAKRKNNQGRYSRTLLKAVSIGLVALLSQGCQTPYLTPEQWNARTNAVNAFSNSAYMYQQAQRPTYAPATPYRPPAQANPFVQNQPQNQQEQPLWGQGSLFGQ